MLSVLVDGSVKIRFMSKIYALVSTALLLAKTTIFNSPSTLLHKGIVPQT